MRKGIAKAEVNNKQSLTIPVRTRTPLEAFQMLRAGQPVDQALAYYIDQNGADKDLFLMDKVEKLQAIADYKSRADYARKVFESDYDEYKKQQEQIKAAHEAEAERQKNEIISNYLKTKTNEGSAQQKQTT